MAIDHNIERLAAYFHAGCRTKQQQRLGVEVEHFIVDSNGQAAAYETIADMMKQAIQQTDALFYEENRLLGYDNQEFSISLEPAAQLEISVMPQHTIEEIERILQKFYRLYEPILQAEGYHFVTLGYHPVCLAQELPLIPKKRYEYMNDYFQTSGRKGIQMMRATASTQVSVDYESEADFREKYRLAVVLTPMLALLTDNAPVYEGQRNEKHLARTLVWADVDADRCGLVPGCMEENFGFTAYASYIYERPMIVMKEGNRTIYTHDTCVSQYYDGREMTTEEIEHMITMFFPDVRLKHYIEIRMADSMPLPYVLAYVQLIQKIFYDANVRRELTGIFKAITESQIIQAKAELIEKGYEGVIYGHPVREWMERIFALAEERCSQEEKNRLAPLSDLCRKGMTLAQMWRE